MMNSATTPIQVLIADDHALIRAGVRLMLTHAPDVELIGEAASGEQAQQRCRELSADVLLLDLLVARRTRGFTRHLT